MHLSPHPPPVALAAVRSKAMDLLLLIWCWLLHPLWNSVIILCFVVCYFVSILVLQSSWWGRENWLLCLICLPVSCDCCVALLHDATSLSAVCDGGISCSYSLTIWASAWDFQQCGMCDQQSLRSACANAQSDKSLRSSLGYSMSVKMLTKHLLEVLSLKEGCRGSSESTLVQMPHWWKSHATAQSFKGFFACRIRFWWFFCIAHNHIEDDVEDGCQITICMKIIPSQLKLLLKSDNK